MSVEPRQSSGGKVAKWFLKKLFTTPPLYLGVIFGIAAGMSYAGNGPTGGAIGFGTMVGLGSSFMALVLIKMVQMLYQNAQSPGAPSESNEFRVIGELIELDQKDDAALLEKLMRERDAVVKRCAGRGIDADADHTLALVTAIAFESFRRAEELQDLVRRGLDPMLEAPRDAASTIRGIRNDLKNAYQAIADAGSRLRRGEQLTEGDFLADERGLASADLSILTEKLKEETAISRRVEERLHPEIESRIVKDSRVGEDSANESGESDQN